MANRRKKRSRPAAKGSAPPGGTMAKVQPSLRAGRPSSQLSTRSAGDFWRGPIPLLAAAAGVFVVVGALFLLSRQTAPSAQPKDQKTAAAVVAQITGVPASVYSTVGTGGVSDPLKKAAGSRLTSSDGKPELLYIGAEYCPYCAAERWSLVAALSRFGTFQGLALTTSGSQDVYPDTATLTFHGSRYVSSYISFSSVELETRTKAPLEKASAAQQDLMSRFDPDGYIPFIDLANLDYTTGSGYRPDVLAGQTWSQIASALTNPSSPSTKAIIGNANYLIAALCRASSQQPANVCDDPSLRSIQARLP